MTEMPLRAEVGLDQIPPMDRKIDLAGFGWEEPEPVRRRTSDELVTVEVRNEPGWLHRNDSPASNYQALWIYAQSPTTPWRSPGSGREIARYLLLDPRYKDADGRPGQDEWWFVTDREWPASYQANNHGQWGREDNWHNTAGDAGSAECSCGGIGWGFGAGPSGLALDWLVGDQTPSVNSMTAYSAEGHKVPMPVPARDQWHTYVMHWVAGRTDGTTVRPGEMQIWWDGQDTPIFDRKNINTVQKATYDGKPYVQRWQTFWQGDYTKALPVEAITRFTLMRMGPTLEVALADRPAIHPSTDAALAGYYQVSGSAPKPTYVRLPSRTASQSKIPPSLLPDPEPPDTLPLHLVREDSRNIWLGWTPVPGRGYSFWVNGNLVSRTNDPTRNEVKFSKRAGDLNEVRALVDGPQGDWQQ